jgi:hypothetical protein
MEIQINDCPVDFKLDSEKTIGEIINAISCWTQQRNLIFTEARINNENYLIDQVPDISIDTINTLNCLVQSKADTIISSMDAGIDYCSRVFNYFNKSVTEKKIDNSEIKNIITGIEWIVEVIGKISDLLGLNIQDVRYKDNEAAFYINSLIEFKKSILHLKENKLLEYISREKEIFPAVSSIFKMLLMSENMRSVVIQNIDSPDVLIMSLYKIKEDIPVQLKTLEEIAIAYQTGKDDVASEKLEHFIDFIFNYSRICYQVAPVFEIDPADVIVGNLSLEKKNLEIQDILYKIKDVMENNDIISLSDIFEYEMKPALENLDQYIDSLTSLLKSNK